MGQIEKVREVVRLAQGHDPGVELLAGDGLSVRAKVSGHRAAALSRIGFLPVLLRIALVGGEGQSGKQPTTPT